MFKRGRYMGLRESYIGRFYYKILRYFVHSCMRNITVDPDKITIIGTIIAVLVPLGFYLSPIIGCILIVVSAIFDSVDGYLARSNGIENPYGAFLDSTMDRFSDFFYLLGFWIVSLRFDYNLLFGLLFFIGLLLTLVFSYTRARIEGLGEECKVGFLERAKRVVFLIIWGLFIWFIGGFWVLIWGILLYNILMAFSVIQRIRCAKRVLKK